MIFTNLKAIWEMSDLAFPITPENPSDVELQQINEDHLQAVYVI